MADDDVIELWEGEGGLWIRHNDRIVDVRFYFNHVTSDRDEAIGSFYAVAEALRSGEIELEDLVTDERKIRDWKDWRQKRVAKGSFEELSLRQQLWAMCHRILRAHGKTHFEQDLIGAVAEAAEIDREEIEDRLEGRRKPDGLIIMLLEQYL